MRFLADNIRSFAATALLFAVASLSAGCESKESQAGNVMNAARVTPEENGTYPLLQKWCSDCHAPPQPTAHKSREWPNVVAQMQNHRVTQGFAKIDDQDLAKLLNYLQNHARP